MKEVNVLAKWGSCGMTFVECDLFKEKGIEPNTILTITVQDANEILQAKKMSLLPLDKIIKENEGNINSL